MLEKKIINQINVAEKIINFRLLQKTKKIICKTLSKLILIDFSLSPSLQMFDTNLESNPEIDICPNSRYVATSGKRSKDLKMYDLETTKKVNKICDHTLKNSAFYFVGHNKALTFSGRGKIN